VTEKPEPNWKKYPSGQEQIPLSTTRPTLQRLYDAGSKKTLIVVNDDYYKFPVCILAEPGLQGRKPVGLEGVHTYKDVLPR
jgi:hypothetical protein